MESTEFWIWLLTKRKRYLYGGMAMFNSILMPASFGKLVLSSRSSFSGEPTLEYLLLVLLLSTSGTIACGLVLKIFGQISKKSGTFENKYKLDQATYAKSKELSTRVILCFAFSITAALVVLVSSYFLKLWCTHPIFEIPSQTITYFQDNP